MKTIKPRIMLTEHRNLQNIDNYDIIYNPRDESWNT
jgi:hypothetical protein